jgi:hypothetical protein
MHIMTHTPTIESDRIKLGTSQFWWIYKDDVRVDSSSRLDTYPNLSNLLNKKDPSSIKAHFKSTLSL